jgi:23S rRNA A2030 N6-methylase RlmJ
VLHPYLARPTEGVVTTVELGQIPARLQRAPDFPSQLKDYTLHQIERMLKQGDFTLATKSQLKLAQKLLRQEDRLMQKY